MKIVSNCPLCEEKGLHIIGENETESQQCINCGYVTSHKLKLNGMSKEDSVEYKKLTDEMMNLSTEVVEDYQNNPSELSGSTIQIHETSPFLQKWLKGDKWKKVLSYIPFKYNRSEKLYKGTINGRDFNIAKIPGGALVDPLSGTVLGRTKIGQRVSKSDPMDFLSEEDKAKIARAIHEPFDFKTFKEAQSLLKKATDSAGKSDKVLEKTLKDFNELLKSSMPKSIPLPSKTPR